MRARWSLAPLSLLFTVAHGQQPLPESGVYLPKETAIEIRAHSRDSVDVLLLRGDGEVTMSSGSESRVVHILPGEFEDLLRLGLDAARGPLKDETWIRRTEDGRLEIGILEDTTLDCGAQIVVRVGAWERDVSCSGELKEALRAQPALADWSAEHLE